VGLSCTLAYAALYLLLRQPLGATGANTLAMFLTAVANTTANRGLTFGVRGAGGRARQQAQGLVVFAATWVISTTALHVLAAVDATAGHATEITVLTLANLLGTALRFLALRAWVFRRSAAPSPHAA
jgi:putative flippase GtrA